MIAGAVLLMLCAVLVLWCAALVGARLEMPSDEL